MDHIRAKIAELTAEIERLQPIVEAQKPLGYDSETDGCRSCFDCSTPEMRQLDSLIHAREQCENDLAHMELYERFKNQIAADDSAMTVWWHLRRTFQTATPQERDTVNRAVATTAAGKAFQSGGPAVKQFIHELNEIQRGMRLSDRLFRPTKVTWPMVTPPT